MGLEIMAEIVHQTGPFLHQPIIELTHSFHTILVELETTQRTLLILHSSATNEDVASRAEHALNQHKLLKEMLSEKAEALRTVLQNAYRVCADFALIDEIPQDNPERDTYLTECLEDTKVMQRDFTDYSKRFERALLQFEKSTLLVSSRKDATSDVTEPNISTRESVDNLFSILHAVPTYLGNLVIFWGAQADALSDYIASPPSTSNGNQYSAGIWLGYQRVLVDASSSIAKSVDAMSVNLTAPQPKSRPSAHNPDEVKKDQRPPTLLHQLWRVFTAIFTGS